MVEIKIKMSGMKKNNLAIEVYHKHAMDLIPFSKDKLMTDSQAKQKKLKQNENVLAKPNQSLPMFYQHKIKSKKFELF
jgi:hypothetical protein